MQKLSILFVAILALGLTQCTGKKLSKEIIVKEISLAMCKKIASCNPDTAPAQDTCSEALQTVLNANPNIKELSASQAQLDACTASIDKADCQGVMGSEPPKGCEFLK